jgi:signal transduction histidine kinase
VEAENRYELDKKELEIRHLEIEQEQRDQKLIMQKKLQNFLFTIIGFGIIIVSLILFLYLTKRRATISLAAAHARVAQQNVQLQELNATKDKFFSIISHDLKGPLNSFTSFARMLIEHTEHLSKEEIQMLAREIDKNLKNLFALLENLLEWSRSQTGNIEFKPEPFDLHELLQQNRDLLQTQAGNKGVTIVYKNNESIPIHAHRHSVNTVIRNLVSNAIKFTPTSGTITLSAKVDPKEVMVAVADTGIGMGPETIKKLFRLDTKYTTNGTANEKGTGLGLILCKDFIEKNGGKIGVHSEEGKGSVFYFTLPRTRIPAPEPETVLTEADSQ